MKQLFQCFLLMFFLCCQDAWATGSHDTALFIPRGDAFWTAFASYTEAASEDIGLNLKIYNAEWVCSLKACFFKTW